jgi:tetratricopeptide (TPR) repeat protein
VISNNVILISKTRNVVQESKGETLEDQGNYSQAIPYFKNVLAVNSSDIVALDGIGTALVDLGNYSNAMNYFKIIYPYHSYFLCVSGYRYTAREVVGFLSSLWC